MTHETDHTERDPALDAAWREHSTEMPPARLDAAILAAAHRAAGSGPQPVTAQETGKRPAESGATTRAATGPQRWWMPLAAAATIGAIALGILQTMPQHESVIAPPASDMPARAVERTAAVPEASRDAMPLKEKSDAARAETDAARTPAAAAPSATSLAGARKQSAKTTAPQATDRIAPSSASLAAAPQPPSASIATAPPPSSAPVAAVPQPFPAEKKAESAQSAESVDMKNLARAAPATEPAVAPPVAQFSDAARKDERQRTEPLQSPPAAAGSMALGKTAANSAVPARAIGLEKTAANSAVPARAIDVDASVVRIRKLHDEGRLADAAKELLALRQAIPDADGRLPPELRAWAATVKP